MAKQRITTTTKVVRYVRKKKRGKKRACRVCNGTGKVGG